MTAQLRVRTAAEEPTGKEEVAKIFGLANATTSVTRGTWLLLTEPVRSRQTKAR